LTFDLLNPRWDLRQDGSGTLCEKGAGIYGNPDFEPEILTNRRDRAGAVGWIARLLLRTKAWRLAANPVVFPLIRSQLLTWTTKKRIIVAMKPE
jgi:hypothetical protein